MADFRIFRRGACRFGSSISPAGVSAVCKKFTSLAQRGKLYPGKHTAIISQELFKRVQAAFAAHNGHKYRRRDIYYSGGLIACAHRDSAVTVEMMGKSTCPYVRCSRTSHDDHPNTRLRGQDVEDQLVEIVRAVELPRDVCAWLRDIALDHQAEEREWAHGQAHKLGEQAQRLRRRLDEAYLDKVDGVISPERYAELSGRWQVELDQIDRSIARHDRGACDTTESAQNV